MMSKVKCHGRGRGPDIQHGDRTLQLLVSCLMEDVAESDHTGGFTGDVHSQPAVLPSNKRVTGFSKGADFAIHFCDASGTNCSTSTGFAASGGSGVPEPLVMSVLASSVLVFGCFFRRFL